MIHLGYIIQTVKAPSFNRCGEKFGVQPRICVLIDDRTAAHYFLSEDEKFQEGTWITFEGEDIEVSDIVLVSEYTFCYTAKWAAYGKGKAPLQLCTIGNIVNKDGEETRLSKNELYAVKRLAKGEKLEITPIPKYDIDSFEDVIKDYIKKVNYVSEHTKEIADSYTLEYETFVKTKTGDDDRLIVTRYGHLLYSDPYLAQYFYVGSEVVIDEGRYGNLSHDFTTEMATKEIQDAKVRFTSNYNKLEHFSTLLFENQTTRQKKIEDIINSNNELLSHWKVNLKILSGFYDGRYMGVKSLIKEIKDYNRKLLENYYV